MFGPVAYIGNTEIMIIAGVVIVLFGGAKMAQLGKGLGEGIREFKKSMSPDDDHKDDHKDERKDEPKSASLPSTAEAK